MSAAHVHLTTDTTVKSQPGQLVAVVLTAGSANATLTVYDNTAASGTVLTTLAALANDSTTWQPSICYSAAIGIHADITGTGASATVVYL